jgi:predicted phosphoadenosine phosphosulfate sulfurtransferase
MNRNIWQINAQSEQYEHGKTCISRAKSYVKTWKERCYEEDIPDEVPFRVMESMRAPSYKAIAMCILNNDLALYDLGFAPHVSHWYRTVKQLKNKETTQLELF